MAIITMYTNTIISNTTCRSPAGLVVQARLCRNVRGCTPRVPHLHALKRAFGPARLEAAGSEVSTAVPGQGDKSSEPQVSLPDSKDGIGVESTAWGEDSSPEDWSAPKPFSLKDVDWGKVLWHVHMRAL